MILVYFLLNFLKLLTKNNYVLQYNLNINNFVLNMNIKNNKIKFMLITSAIMSFLILSLNVFIHNGINVGSIILILKNWLFAYMTAFVLTFVLTFFILKKVILLINNDNKYKFTVIVPSIILVFMVPSTTFLSLLRISGFNENFYKNFMYYSLINLLIVLCLQIFIISPFVRKIINNKNKL